VIWTADQAKTYVAKAKELGWAGIVAMLHVFDGIGQSPVDVRTLLRSAYDGKAIKAKRIFSNTLVVHLGDDIFEGARIARVRKDPTHVAVPIAMALLSGHHRARG
jgi:hypothetical protein